MSTFSPATSNHSLADWRSLLAVTLLMLAAMPVQIYSVPGFEITPSLVLAAAALLLFDPAERIHYYVLAFLAFCGSLGLFGIYGPEGPIRNITGAASYSSGAPYIMVGMLLAKRDRDLSGLLKVITPAALVMTAIFCVDLTLTRGNLVKSAAYVSASYVSADTTYVDSFFPFYGKYAVITLATITMTVGAISLGSLRAFDLPYAKAIVLLSSNALMFIAFSMWSRQVMLGTMVFYLVLVLLAFRQKATWISLLIFLALFAPLGLAIDQRAANEPAVEQLAESAATNTTTEDSSQTSEGIGETATAIANYKLERAARNIRSGNLEDLSTGRLSIYKDALEKISVRIFMGGCGFCNLKSTLGFGFSSLHNVPLNALFKGGLVYAALYVGTAFFGLLGLWSMEKTFARDVAIAVLASLSVQSLVNDVLYFQVVPVLLFSLTGFLLAARRQQVRCS